MMSSCASVLSSVAIFVFPCSYSSVGVTIGGLLLGNLPVDDKKDDGSGLDVSGSNDGVVGDKLTNSTSGEHEGSTEQ